MDAGIGLGQCTKGFGSNVVTDKAELGEIPRALNNLGSEIECLEQYVERMQPILSPSRNENNAGTPVPVKCDLANSIDSYARRIRDCWEMLSRNQL